MPVPVSHVTGLLRQLPQRVADARALGAAVADELARRTLRRLFVVALIAMPVHLAHLAVLWQVEPATPAAGRWRVGILASHTALLVLMAAMAAASGRLRHRERPGLAGWAACWAALLSVLLAGVVITTVDQWVTASITPFLVACVVVGLIFLVRPWWAALAYLGAYGLFAAALQVTQPDPVVLLSNRVNAITSVAVGLCLSVVLWHSEARNVLQQRQIAAQQRELEARNTELAHLASTDVLTGVANRWELERRLVAEQERMRRWGHSSSLLLLDLDHFKQVNDDHGHPVGDRVLRQMAEVLRGQLRAVDILARWGGEEFAILLPGTDVGGAQAIAERLRSAVETQPLVVDGRAIRLTVSVGVAALSAASDGLESSYATADRALYEAKGRGRNRVAVGPQAA